jgi:hypothetical protein
MFSRIHVFVLIRKEYHLQIIVFFFVFFKGCRVHLLSHSEKNESLNEFNMKLDDAIFMYFIGRRKNHKNPHRWDLPEAVSWSQIEVWKTRKVTHTGFWKLSKHRVYSNTITIFASVLGLKKGKILFRVNILVFRLLSGSQSSTSPTLKGATCV